LALLMSLLPASATIIGVIVLHQLPNPVEIAGIGLVAAGVALRGRVPGSQLLLISHPGAGGQLCRVITGPVARTSPCA